jgi:hypothetical protein
MVCNCLKRLDSGFRRNDGKRYFWTFYEAINIKCEEINRWYLILTGRFLIGIIS